MTPQKKESVWFTVSMMLCSALITGLAAWLGFAQGSVTRSEVSAMIATESPWIADRKMIVHVVEKNEHSLEEIKRSINALELDGRERTTKIDRLINELNGGK